MDYFGVGRPAGSGLLNLARVPSYKAEAIAFRSQSATPRPSCTLERSSSTTLWWPSLASSSVE